MNKFATLALAMVMGGVLAAAELKPLRVVENLDLARYAGTWYEVARLPNRFQERCAGGVRATYALKPDRTISVLNQCRLADGGQIEAKGVARLADKRGKTSVLKVRFAPGFLSFLPQVWGDYQVIALAPDYSYALVGDPARKYLWILSRTPTMEAAIYRRLEAEASGQGFDVSRIVRTIP